ncbi:MAG TPA: toll/interleukin-1 receptor domain-containing protein, partial [Plasticicumulans sp.]|nr:toll/interleukin-1 receptor domain-containing protein [Plasticicumulans sp.]
MPVRVFISYSHDSEAHRQRVLAFVQALRGHGIDADLDQFHGETIVHWPTWCRQRMDPEHSDFVLCICTAGYRQRINGNVAPEQGRGVYWEGALMQSELYDGKGNRRFLPVLFDDEPEQSIVECLRGWTQCRVRQHALTDDGYELLLRILTNQPRATPDALGQVPEFKPAPALAQRPAFPQPALPDPVDLNNLPDAAPDFLGRSAELALLDTAWTETGKTRAVVLVAPGGTGKTSVVRRWLSAMDHDGWRGALRVFGWSFYSQGTAEDRQA